MSQRILITGGTGSLGSTLAKKWYATGNHITIVSRDDHKQAALRQILPQAVFHSLDLGNGDSYRRLLDIVQHQDFCVHCAAQKVVGESQYQPFAYLYSNIMGTLYLQQAWKHVHGDCKRFLLIATDKAVSPINTYGLSKGLASSLIRTEGYDGSVVRYGNVVTSNGAFIQKWQECKAKNQPIPVKIGQPSNQSPTRFFLTMDGAVELIEEAVHLVRRGCSGVFVPLHLRAFSVLDVARATGLEIESKCLEPGEKLHEVLLAPGEKWDYVGSDLLGRMTLPYWPDDGYYEMFRSDTAPRMSGVEVLEVLGWN